MNRGTFIKSLTAFVLLPLATEARPDLTRWFIELTGPQTTALTNRGITPRVTKAGANVVSVTHALLDLRKLRRDVSGDANLTSVKTYIKGKNLKFVQLTPADF